MSTFSPINLYKQSQARPVNHNGSSQRLADHSDRTYTKPLLRESILKASNALDLPSKKRRISTLRAHRTEPPPRGRLATPPAMLQELGASGNLMSHRDCPNSPISNGRSFDDLCPDYDAFPGDFPVNFGGFDAADEVEDSYNKSDYYNDKDVFYGASHSTRASSKPSKLEKRSNIPEIISLESDSDEVDENSLWKYEFPSDAHIFSEINGDNYDESALSTLRSPQEKAKAAVEELVLFPSKQARPTRFMIIQERPTSAEDLTRSTPDKPDSEPHQPQAFVRPRFPKVLPQSSILPNLSSAPRILTCFRIADILRAISSTSDAPLLEVFALVTSSHRIQSTQHFTCSDLFFPSRPPHIPGTYFGWQGIDLFEDDTRPFLKAEPNRPIMCRAICYALMPKKQARSAIPSVRADVNLRILSIWSASWEDVEYNKGLVL